MQRNLDADDLTPVSDDLAVWQTIPKIERVTSVAFLQFRATGDSQRLVAMRICHVDSSLVANAGGFARFPGFTPRIPVNPLALSVQKKTLSCIFRRTLVVRRRRLSTLGCDSSLALGQSSLRSSLHIDGF
jgi:hypothetical protein